MPNAIATSPREILKPKSKINFKKAFDLKFLHGLSDGDIAKQFKVSTQAVNQYLQPIVKFIKSGELYPIYKDNESKLLQVTESILLQNLLDEDRLKKASVNNLAYAYDKIRAARKGHSGKGAAITIELVFQDAEAEAKKLRKHHADIVINKVGD